MSCGALQKMLRRSRYNKRTKQMFCTRSEKWSENRSLRFEFNISLISFSRGSGPPLSGRSKLRMGVLVFAALLQCVAVCCSVLQCIAVYCSVLQCVAVCCRMCSRMCCSVPQCVAVCCSVLQYIVVCFNVLRCAAVSCSEL